MIGLNGFLRLNKQKGVLFIDVREVGKYLKIPDEDGDTDQEYLKDNYLGCRKLGDEKRKCENSLCYYDWKKLYYPNISEPFRKWWEKYREKVVEIMQGNPNYHIVFVANFIWTWYLLPLESDTAIGNRFSVAMNDDFIFATKKPTNGTFFVGEGNVESDWTGGVFEGWPSQKKIYKQFCSDIKDKTYRFSKLHDSKQFETGLRCNDSRNDLPDYVHISCHGHENELELKDGAKLRGSDIKHILEHASGSIQIFVMESCWSAEFIQNSGLMKTRRIGSAVCHTGIADESYDTISFLRVFWSHLLKGSSVGCAFLEAKRSTTPEEPSSGSFMLLGDPTIRFV